ncbi:MAG: hypothetical protein MHPSP_002739, partial [Paramarteilia canceri]
NVTGYELTLACYDENQRHEWQSEFDHVFELLETKEDGSKIFNQVSKKMMFISSRQTIHSVKMCKASFDEALNYSESNTSDETVSTDSIWRKGTDFWCTVTNELSSHSSVSLPKKVTSTPVKIDSEVISIAQTISDPELSNDRNHLLTEAIQYTKVDFGGWLNSHAISLIASVHAPRLINNLFKFLQRKYIDSNEPILHGPVD